MLKHKKLLSLLLAATMLFTVTGCGGGTDDGGAAGDTGESRSDRVGRDRQHLCHRRDG